MISVRRYASSLRHSEADLSISYCFISWPCEYPGLSFQRSPVCACSLVSSLLLSGATMSQQPSLTQSAHSVRQVLTAYTVQLYDHLVSLGHNVFLDEAREIDGYTKILPGSPVQT